MRLTWVEERLKEWCNLIPAQDALAGDIEFPSGSGIWHRPGALAESRMLGRWSTQGSTSVWNEAMWLACLQRQDLDASQPLEIGCDVARFGDDFTTIIVRRGNCVLHHETHNGWSTTQTAGRLKQLATQFAKTGEDPRTVLICVDDDGVGGGVVDQKDGWTFQPVNGASTPRKAADYPNVRSETWFATAQRANSGELDLSRLSQETLFSLRRQVMAPTHRLDERGRRVVEPKAETKRRLGRSPDDADALNLAFASRRTVVHKLRMA